MQMMQKTLTINLHGSEGFLKGQGEEAKKLIRDFRENF